MPHFHGPAVNVLLVGLKLWFLFPPSEAGFSDLHVRRWYETSYHNNATAGGTQACSATERPQSVQWLLDKIAEHTSVDVDAVGGSRTPQAGSVVEVDTDRLASTVPHLLFLQEPGDLVYVPSHWGHAVLNLADTVALAYE
jgi:hypothetical protein